jgi:hypothetical protein
MRIDIPENKRKVSINITKHEKTFINPNLNPEQGNEITKEQLFNKEPKTDEQS